MTFFPGQTFRREVGLALRVGVGGLWGGFGWLWTPRGMYELWISRQDGFVLIERDGGRPLLLTPTDPERFVRLLTPPHAADASAWP